MFGAAGPAHPRGDAASRSAAFPADEPLDDRGRAEATGLAGRLRRVDEGVGRNAPKTGHGGAGRW